MTNSESKLAVTFLEFTRNKLLNQYWPRTQSCVESLTDEQIWWRPNPACNSIGNLLLHLNGNVNQWLVASFNALDDTRNRPAEFGERRRIPGRQLLDRLDATMREVEAVLTGLAVEDLLKSFHIQGYTVTGLEAIYQVTEHFGLHYGQIVYITKQLRESDLGFYRELNPPVSGS